MQNQPFASSTAIGVAIATVSIMLCLLPGCSSVRASQMNCGTMGGPGDVSLGQLKKLKKKVGGCRGARNMEMCTLIDQFENARPFGPTALKGDLRRVGIVYRFTPGKSKEPDVNVAHLDYIPQGEAAAGRGGDGSLPLISVRVTETEGLPDSEALTQEIYQGLFGAGRPQLADNALSREAKQEIIYDDEYMEACGSQYMSTTFVKGTRYLYSARVTQTAGRMVIMFENKILNSKHADDEIKVFAFPLDAKYGSPALKKLKPNMPEPDPAAAAEG